MRTPILCDDAVLLKADEVDLRVDLLSQRVWHRGEPVHLTPNGFGILACLVYAAGELLTREQLLARVWAGVVVKDKIVDVEISRLRRSLPNVIKTEYQSQNFPGGYYI